MDEASSHLNKSKRPDAELRDIKRQEKRTHTNVPKFFVFAILTVFFCMNITTSSRVQERAASCNSGSNFETNLRLGPEDLVKRPVSREETESDRILIWMIDMQKWIAIHAHVEVRESAKRRKPRTRPKIRYEARMIGHRRWRATRRRKGSDLQMAQKAIVAKRQGTQDTQDFSNGLQGSLRKQEAQTTLPNYERGYAEVQAQKRNKQMHIANGNTSPNAKKGNFSQRQAKRSALETDKRMAQILFNTWGIENASQKIADLMRQDRRRMQNITKTAEEDLAKAKEK